MRDPSPPLSGCDPLQPENQSTSIGMVGVAGTITFVRAVHLALDRRHSIRLLRRTEVPSKPAPAVVGARSDPLRRTNA